MLDYSVIELDYGWSFVDKLDRINTYHSKRFTYEEAVSAYLSLENCDGCYDCVDCYDCIDCVSCDECYDCVGCAYCVECDNCYRCEDCKNCSFCHDVECRCSYLGVYD